MFRISLCCALIVFFLGWSRVQGQETTIQPQPPEVRIVKGQDTTAIIISGVGPVDKQGRLVAPDDFAGQFKQTWENLRRLAAGAGSPLGNIVTMTVYTTDEKWQETFSQMQSESFNAWNPATTFAVAKQLRTPGALLEIHAVAIIQERKPKR